MNGDEPTLDRKVVALTERFERERIAYALGGAIALAYYAEPRATIDIDVNVFVAPNAIDDVAAVLASLGVEVDEAHRRSARRDGQVRVWWGVTPLDLFFSTDAFHDHAATRVRRVPFGDTTIVVLAPEDLAVCKIVFDRRKDWWDLEQMLLITAGALDVASIRDWLVAAVGEDDQRISRFDAVVADVLG